MATKNGTAIHVRLYRDQLIEIQKAALDQGLNVSTYLRREGLLAARRFNASPYSNSSRNEAEPEV